MATGGRKIVTSRSLKGAVRSVGMRNRSSERVMSSDSSMSTRRLSVTRIYSDDAGDSHFGSFTIDMKGSGDIGYLSRHVRCEDAILFRHTPASYKYSWHNAPRRQFIVNLDGDVEIEVSSGEKRILRRGTVFFVEDVTGKGHFSRSVDNQPRNSIFIPVPDDFVAQDC